MMFITGRTLRKLVSQSFKIFKEIGTTPKSRKEAYIDEKKSLEERSIGDICPTEKSSQMELLKLKFFHLPAPDQHKCSPKN